MISSAITTTTTLPPSPIHRFSRLNASIFTPSLSLHQRVRGRDGAVCHVELPGDAPFAAAIGACVFSSLLFPAGEAEEDSGEEDGGAFDSDDSRLIVMSVISFIPYFNWLSWIFAFLDTGKTRYAVYSLVYLLPYIRSNLSLSTDESWLPVASIILCVLHVQLEMSIKNGDIQGFQLFREMKISRPKFEEKRDREIGGWGDSHDGKRSNEGKKKNKR